MLIVIGVLGATGWYALNSKRKTDQILNQAAQINQSVPMPSKKTANSSPTVAQITYTSEIDHASFQYPSTWKKVSLDPSLGLYSGGSTLNAISLQSPDKTVIVSWVADMGGVGGECDHNAPLGETGSGGLLSCIAQTALNSTAIPGAPGLYVNSGYAEYDQSTFYPWLAVGSKYAAGETDRSMGYEVFTTQNDELVFAIGGINIGKPALAFPTKDKAIAFLSTDSAKQAKQIMLSLKIQQ